MRGCVYLVYLNTADQYSISMGGGQTESEPMNSANREQCALLIYCTDNVVATSLVQGFALHKNLQIEPVRFEVIASTRYSASLSSTSRVIPGLFGSSSTFSYTSASASTQPIDRSVICVAMPTASYSCQIALSCRL